LPNLFQWRYEMNIPTDLKYTKTDEWFDPVTGKAGLTDFAQGQLSDIVFVEVVVAAGDSLEVGKPIASVESVKAAAESYSPLAGKVVAINEGLADNPELLNSDPYGKGWLVQIDSKETTGLMDSTAYTKYCEERAH
jgi:glycine cleavage system H protein